MRTSVTAVALLIWGLLAVMPAKGQISYPDFRLIPLLKLNGDAARQGDRLRLTPARRGQAGAAWHSVRQYVREGFITHFKFQISEPGGKNDGISDGGDGFAFVIHHSDSGDTAIGHLGGEIGYGGIPRSIAIEFDLWNNGFQETGDPSSNHVSVHTNGLAANSADHGSSIGETSSIPDLGDGAIHDVVIQYLDRRLAIYIDGCTSPVLTVPVDINTRLALDSGYAWLGFTSGTASAWENHDILSWEVTSIGLPVSGPLSICEGDSLVLTVPTLDGDVLWSTGEKGRSITVWEPGEYWATVAEKKGCTLLTYRRNVILTIVPIPEPVITVSRPLPLCPGDSVILDAGPGYRSYRWSSGERTQRIVVTTNGRYSVEAANELGCSTLSAAVDVEVHVPPAPVIVANRSLTLCAGDSVILDAGEGYVSYLWSSGQTTRTIVVKTGGNYSVKVTDRNGCSGIAGAVPVMVGSTLRPVIQASGPTELCAGEAVRLDAGPDYASYRWSNGATTRTILVDRPGEYHVMVTARGGCRGRSDTVNVVVHPRPLPTIVTSAPPVICNGGSLTLDAGPGYAGYTWSNGESTQTITISSPGRYMVTVATAAGCTGAATIDVIEGSMPEPVITPGGALHLCTGDSITLSAGEGYARYRWSNGDTTSSIIVRDAGTFEVTVTNTAGCTATSAPVTVALRQGPMPVIRPGGPLNFCTGDSVTLHAPHGYAAYSWSNGETGRSIVVKDSRAYSVTVTDDAGCRGTSPPVEVVAGASLSPQILMQGDDIICAGDSLLLEAPAGYAGYLWSTGERTRSIIVREGGSYQVTVDNGGGCSGTSDIVTVQVRPGPPVPVITAVGNELRTGSGAAYQWYLEGSPISSANGRIHIPTTFGHYSVQVADENGCTSRSLPYPHFDASSTVSLPAIAGAPGTIVTIPLRLDASRNLDGQRSDHFRIAIRYDGRLLVPGGVTSCCGSVGNLSTAPAGSGSDYQILTFEAPRSQGMTSGVLAEIRFSVAIGASATTPLAIETFEWTGASVAITKVDGLFRLDDLCGSGGARLVDASEELSLKPIRPNPLSGPGEIEFGIVEDGLTELYLTDALGRRVLTLLNGTQRAGRYLVPFDAASLPAGLYFCVLRTPTAMLTNELIVQK